MLFAVTFHIFAFGLVSAFAPNYLCLLLFRGLVGIGIGGGFLALVLMFRLENVAVSMCMCVHNHGSLTGFMYDNNQDTLPYIVFLDWYVNVRMYVCVSPPVCLCI